MGEQRLWEKSYPPGVRWDAPIEMATLPALFDAFTEQVGGQAGARISRPKTTYAELRAASTPSPPA